MDRRLLENQRAAIFEMLKDVSFGGGKLRARAAGGHETKEVDGATHDPEGAGRHIHAHTPPFSLSPFPSWAATC